jgi:hypothetical protein
VNKIEGIDGRKYFYFQVAKHLQSYYPVGNPDDREDKSCGPVLSKSVAAAAQQNACHAFDALQAYPL